MAANGYLTYNGLPLIGPSGAPVLATVPAAPNGIDIGARAHIVTPISGTPYVVVVVPGGFDPDYTHLRVVWRGPKEDTAPPPTWRFPLQEGNILLGDIGPVMGRLAGVNCDYELCLESADGVGYSFGLLVPIYDTSTSENRAAQIDTVTIAGDGLVGGAQTLGWSGDAGLPAGVVTFEWRINSSDTVVGTGASYTPSGDDFDVLHGRVIVTNSEGAPYVDADPITLRKLRAPAVSNVVIQGGGENSTPHSVTYDFDPGYPAVAATIAWTDDGVAVGTNAAGYTPVTNGTLGVTVAATNGVGSTSLGATKTITSTPANTAPNIAALAITSASLGVAGVLHTAVRAVTGTPGPTEAWQWFAAGVAISGATSINYTPPVTMNATALTVRLTATNTVSSAVRTSDPVTINAVVPPRATSAQWSIRTKVYLSATSTRVDEVDFIGTLNAVAAQWTTADASLTDAQVEALDQFEDMTLVGTVSGMTLFSVPDVIVGSRNFRLFNTTLYPADLDRAGRFSVRYKTASGVWSPRTEVKAVTFSGGASKLHPGDWIPLISRTKPEFDNAIVGGRGYQYFRAWGYSPAKPDRLIGGQDVAALIRTNDFGSWWERPACTGLKSGVSASGMAIDSTDGDRVLTLYSAGSFRGGATPNGWDTYSGISLSTDGAQSFALAHQIDAVPGSATNDAGETNSRYIQYPFVEMPGGTPSTRTWYCLCRQMPKASVTTGGFLAKSTNGGATWTRVRTFTTAQLGTGMWTGMWRHPVSGIFWILTSTGVFKLGTNPESGTLTDTQPNGLGTGLPLCLDVGGASAEVWVACQGNGLYKTTNNGDAWTRIGGAYDIRGFSICPTNRDIIIRAGKDNSVSPGRSVNGGTAWGPITLNYPPQEANEDKYRGNLQYSHFYMQWHATRPGVAFVARFQYFGITTDYGASVQWASNNFDYNFVHEIGVDPTDWTRMLVSMTDRVAALSTTGHDWVYDDGVDSATKDAIGVELAVTAHLGSGRGAVILANGAHRAYLCALGDGTRRCPLRLNASGANPIGGTPTILDGGGANPSWCEYGSLDPTDNSRAYMGRWRFDLASNGVLTQTAVANNYEVLGCDSAGNIYGTPKSANATIYRSTAASAGAAWTLWATLPSQPRHEIGAPTPVSINPGAANQGLFACKNGRVYHVSGSSSPTVTVVFDLTVVGGPAWPFFGMYDCKLDPNNSGVGYVSANRYGGPVIWKITGMPGSPVVTDISGTRGNMSSVPHRLFVHPATSDLIASYQQGSIIYPAHVAQANSLYNRNLANLQRSQI